MKKVKCEICGKIQDARERYDTFQCCGKRQKWKTHLFVDKRKKNKKNSILSNPLNSFSEKEDNLINSDDEVKTSSLEIQEEKIEDELKEDKEEKKEFKYQCANCKAMFDEYENNKCPNPDCNMEF
jgi:hypothetical protein